MLCVLHVCKCPLFLKWGAQGCKKNFSPIWQTKLYRIVSYRISGISWRSFLNEMERKSFGGAFRKMDVFELLTSANSFFYLFFFVQKQMHPDSWLSWKRERERAICRRGIPPSPIPDIDHKNAVFSYSFQHYAPWAPSFQCNLSLSLPFFPSLFLSRMDFIWSLSLRRPF